MDLKLLLVSTLFGTFCYIDAQKGKISQPHFILLNGTGLYTALLYHHYSVTWYHFVDVNIDNLHIVPNGDYHQGSLEREREREATYFILMMSLTRGSTLALLSMEDNGKDRIFRLCLRLPLSHTVFHMKWCVNTGGLRLLTLPGLCLLPLILPLLLSSLCFSSRGEWVHHCECQILRGVHPGGSKMWLV